MSASSLQLVQITDPHVQGDRHAVLRGVTTYQTLCATFADAQQRFPDSDGYLLTGDLVHDDPDGYALIRECFANCHVPVFCLPGNHDIPLQLQRALQEPPFITAPHTTLKGWSLILLDSWVPHSAAGELGIAQLHTLQHLLTQHADTPTLLCVHHHPIAMHSAWLDSVALNDAPALRNLITQHPQVRGICCGHVHQALDQRLDGIYYMATPATCAQFLPRSHDFASDPERPPGYRVINLQADGQIDSQVIWLNTP